MDLVFLQFMLSHDKKVSTEDDSYCADTQLDLTTAHDVQHDDLPAQPLLQQPQDATGVTPTT